MRIEVQAFKWLGWVPIALTVGLAIAPAQAQGSGQCDRVVKADVVALDQVYFWNRYGAVQPHGMMYALKHDVVHVDDYAAYESGEACDPNFVPKALSPGEVTLRPGKRPRPLVLRLNAGECLQVELSNMLHDPRPTDPSHEKHYQDQPATREVSIAVTGMQYVDDITDSGMWVGTSQSGLVSPGGSRTYRLFAQEEGTFLIYSGGAMVGGEGDNGSISAGLFGAVNVQPTGSRFFRSQVTREDLDLATLPVVIAEEEYFSQQYAQAMVLAYPAARINYTATYPGSSSDPDYCWRPSGTPILEMTDASDNIIHSDLTAIVTGPNLGNLSSVPDSDPVYPHRAEPFREFTIIFHDEIGAVQAFPHFQDRILQHTLHSVRDAFAINYGTGGIGAEILANRLGVGPVHDCVDCKYEEFFLTSWAVGDPAMIVDKPANYPCSQNPSDWKKLSVGNHTYCDPETGPKATKAFYPDDPSNVYHSYMNDHVRFRNLLAGSDDHHIFHLHAHQWLNSRKSDKSSYMDSRAIGQGTGHTYEIAYEGSGNRNKTVGDSIFHCHFYPHFAQGMWALWRVHDVLERGTKLDADGRPVAVEVANQLIVNTRALPDGEIKRGTPIPAIVPIPGKPIAPPPTATRLVDGDIDVPYTTTAAQNAKNAQSPYFNPGFPFYIPGNAGHRPPAPPMDFAKDANGNNLDGGLPRHQVQDGGAAVSAETRLDFHKEILALNAIEIDDDGTPLEKLAMETHEVASFNTPSAGGPTATRPFELNGHPRQPGAPYADPCVDDAGQPIPDNKTRTYKAVDIELDVVLNKAGWHFPQQRIGVLMDDVEATLNNQRPPEPLFFRANSGECIQFELTNLVPKETQVDDFQVRTPTDILGQHIHLVKFDVTSSDGGGNGYNYEDGTFSPEEVQERIHAIREANGCPDGFVQAHFPDTQILWCPEAEVHPDFPDSPDRNCNGFPDYLGAQTTIQRWWVDPVVDSDGNDRTLRTVFTHDHFGPSTHQQAGLYAGLVVEQEGSSWYHNETGELLGGPGQQVRDDGGPTTWQAWIDPPQDEEYREFLLEYADFQLAYEPNEFITPSNECPHPFWGYADPGAAINPPGRKSVGPPKLYEKPNVCPTNPDDPDGSILDPTIWYEEIAYYQAAQPSQPGVEPIPYPTPPPPPCPEAVSADDPGFVSVNYRSEPLALRLRDPSDDSQASGLRGDPSFAYETRTDRADSEFNKLPHAPDLTWVPYPALTSDLQAGDPFTPLIRAFEGDNVQVRTLVGAHEEEHNFTIHGNKWRYEPFDPNSGWRNSNMAGISEWHDFFLRPVPELDPGQRVDFLYKPTSAAEWQWSGAWGLMRIYKSSVFPWDAEFQFQAPAIPAGATSNVSGEVDRGEFQFAKVDAALTTVQSFEDFAVNEAASAARAASGSQQQAQSIQQVEIACPPDALSNHLITYDVTAVAAAEALPSGVTGSSTASLLYNRRTSQVEQEDGPLHDPTAIMFVRTQDLNYGTGRPQLNSDAPVEPLILRANAGDCIRVVLRNDIWDSYQDLPGWNGWHMIVEDFNANDVAPSLDVALHPQLVYFDPKRSDGSNVGINPGLYGKQSVSPGQVISYYWYAGEIFDHDTGAPQVTAIEFGSTGLSSSDPLKHSNKGAIGALIIEPEGSTWAFPDRHPYDPSTEPATGRRTYAEATVTKAGGSKFREFVTVFQDDVNLRFRSGNPVPSLYVNEDPTESAQKAFNYRTEPIWFRMGHDPMNEDTGDLQFADSVSNGEIGGMDPLTHIFNATVGTPTRFRIVHPAGHTQNHVAEVQGHLWQEQPYINGSTALGDHPESEYQGTRYGVGPTSHYDFLLENGAGGAFGVTGDYMYRDFVPWGFDNGMWGIFRVAPVPPPPPPRDLEPKVHEQVQGADANGGLTQ